MGRPAEAREGGMSKSLVIGLLFAAVVLALMIYAGSGLARHSCEVCITYRGETACRRADGSTEEEARQTATSTACAVLAAGMTETLKCTGTPPKSETCDGGY